MPDRPGDVVVARRKGCKRLILRWQPDRGVFHLSVPQRLPEREIDRFLASQVNWMEEHRQQIVKSAYLPGERHPVLGQYVTLGEKGVPAGEAAFCRWRKQQWIPVAKQLFQLWAERMQVTGVEKVTFRDMRSRWGSCRSDGRHISLNTRLSLMPEAVTEYVIVHELSHVYHHDHSKDFYAVMTRFLPDWQQRKTILDRFSMPPEAAAREAHGERPGEEP